MDKIMKVKELKMNHSISNYKDKCRYLTDKPDCDKCNNPQEPSLCLKEATVIVITQYLVDDEDDLQVKIENYCTQHYLLYKEKKQKRKELFEGYQTKGME